MADYTARLPQRMKIVIFSGTTEGRKLSRELAEMGAPVWVCVATEYGKVDQGTYPGVKVLAGRRDRDGIAQLLGKDTLCIDATHPYAEQVTRNIRGAAQQTGTMYKRLLRPASALPKDCQMAENIPEAVNVLQATSGNVLLTTGAKEVTSFAPLGAERLYARVLPVESSLIACRDAGIPASHIIAMQGPFGVELNVALLHQFSIRWLVTKDGGNPGGFAEKLEAARKCGVQSIVIRRPADHGESYEAVLEFCKEWITQCR